MRFRLLMKMPDFEKYSRTTLERMTRTGANMDPGRAAIYVGKLIESGQIENAGLSTSGIQLYTRKLQRDD